MSQIYFRIEKIIAWHARGNLNMDSGKNYEDYFLDIKVDYFYSSANIEIKRIQFKSEYAILIEDKQIKNNFDDSTKKIYISDFFQIKAEDNFVFKDDKLEVFKTKLNPIEIKKIDFPRESPIFKRVKVTNPFTSNKSKRILIEIEEKEIIPGFKLKFIELSSSSFLWIPNTFDPRAPSPDSPAFNFRWIERFKLLNWNELIMKEALKKQGENFVLEIWDENNIGNVEKKEPDGSKPEQPEPDETPPSSPPPPPPPVAPTATEIAAAKQNAQTALNSGDQAQLTTAKTALENLKQRLENAGASATEISDLINQIQTKLQTLMGDEAYRQIVLTEIANKLTENGLTENDLDAVSKTKLRNLKDKRTSGSQINKDAEDIKNQADQIMVEKKVISLTSQVAQVIQNGQKQAKETLKNEIMALLNDSRYREKKPKLQALIQELENSLKDQSPSSNHNSSSSFPWGYVIPIALIIVALMVGLGVIISKRKKKKKIK